MPAGRHDHRIEDRHAYAVPRAEQLYEVYLKERGDEEETGR
jgi:hypothetical protein